MAESAGTVVFQKDVVNGLLDIEVENGILYFALPIL